MGSRIAQLANFYGETSGGLRTAVDTVGQGYVDAGFERVLVVPGACDADEDSPSGRRITLHGRRIPGGGGYRVLTDLDAVRACLREVAPDRVEVSDKLTLGAVGDWARREGVPSVLWSHERIDAILAPRLPPGVPLRTVAKRWNGHLLRHYDSVVCSSAFAAEEYTALGAASVVRVPLGVDLKLFHPDARGASPVDGGVAPRLVCVGRLSKEKRPDVAIEAVRLLRGIGVDASLWMVGDGPMRPRLERLAGGLPVTFTRHVRERVGIAALLAQADLALAPCPCETFGLAVLEALACGTPAVVADRGAAGELLGRVTSHAGRAVAPDPAAFAAAAAELLGVPAGARRVSARTCAEAFPWSRTISSMLRVHGLQPPEGTAA
jgi:alpha-1,6-mannosyltransferase